MVRLLKRRVIITSMILVTILIVGVFLTLNIVNISTLNAVTDNLLDELAVIYGYNPHSLEELEAEEAEKKLNVGEKNEFSDPHNFPNEQMSFENVQEGEYGTTEYIDDGNNPVPHDGSEAPSPFMSFLLKKVNANEILGAVYYTVVIRDDGHIDNVDIERVAGVTRREATDKAWAAHKSGKDTGWFDEYKYTVAKDPDGYSVYIFLNRESDINNCIRLIIVSACILVVTWFLLLLLEILLANRLIKPVAENMEKQKQFITDAGHEIKTPLAIIQANTEALELFNGENKWTGNIKNQTMRLSNLMSNMLMLAKTEEMAVEAVPEAVDISQVCIENIEMFNEPAAQRNISILDNMENCPCVKGNKNQYSQLISILLDNAIKYSAEYTEITFDSVNKEKNIVVIITNIATSIPECDPEMLFDRFYRPESSRYYYTTGNGIGLASARAIMELYGGTITCRYEYGNKMVFTLTFKK